MATPSVPPYETLYGVGILDDIHNYFPALLYDSEAFTTVPDVLAYVQLQTRRRFDLFSIGRGAYIRNQRRPYVPRYMETNVNRTEILNLFTTLLNPNLAGLNANFLNPVIVRPSPEIINAHTTVSILDAATTEVCAVCQDGYEVGNERRSLNVCHHTFHKSCIDTWFQENVHCPVCRHDIRILTVPTNEPTTE